MTTWLPIRYRGYWDVPRIFLVQFANGLYLFDCLFSEALDDYPDDFTVYLLPDLSDADIPNDWTTLSGLATRVVGTVPVSAVRFDPTKRAAIDADIFDSIRPTAAPVNGTQTHAQPPTHVS